MPGENRKRKRMVPIRLSDEEFERVEHKACALGMTVPAFLRELAQKQRVHSPVIDREGAAALSRQIRAIGNNINQLTKLAHTEKVTVVQLDDVRMELNALRQQLSSLLQNKQTASSTTVSEKQQNKTV